MIRRVVDASVALLLYDRLGGMGLGSAICVRVGDHLLLATAAHNVRHVDFVRPIPRGCYRGDPLRPLAMGIGHAADGDVAWIELCPSLCRRRGVECLELGDLALGELLERDPLMAHGFPAHGIDPRRLAGTRFELTAAEVTGHAATPRSRDELALAWRHRDLPPAFRPTGLSGGGIWRLAEDGDRHQLVGLSRAWHAGSKLLFGSRIAQWLHLVARDFPDLQPDLQPLLAEFRAAPRL